MPFCTSCGTAVSERAAFCQNCGRPQPVARVPPATGDPLGGMSAESVSTLCYVPWIGWILSLVVLATHRFRNDGLVRFHAFQGMYLAVVWLVVDIALEPALQLSPMRRPLISMLQLGLLGVWIFMLIRTHARQLVRLPVLGELAERSVNEQGNGGRL